MRNTTYIWLSIAFITLSCLVYGLILVLFPVLGNEWYYNGVAIYRLLFTWGATYMTFDVYRNNRNTIEAWVLKWICVYITGFQFVRLTFNWFVTDRITKLEIGVMVAGLAFTIYKALNDWKSDHT